MFDTFEIVGPPCIFADCIALSYCILFHVLIVIITIWLYSAK